MAGKGSGRYHARQQCSDELMQLKWDLAFEKDEAKKQEILDKIKELEAKNATKEG